MLVSVYKSAVAVGLSLALWATNWALADAAGSGDTREVFKLDLEQLSEIRVRSVDFFETSLSRSPNNIKVLTHHDIDNLPALTLSDFIDLYVPGAHLAKQFEHGHQFGVRGITRGGAAKTLVMWDGQSLNQRNNWGNMTVYSSHLLGDLEQVEIVLGPGSLVHGSGALNGYVNFVPKSGSDHRGLRSRLDRGLRDDLRKLQVSYGDVYGDERHYFLYAGFVKADGFGYGSDFGGATGSVANPRKALLELEGDPVFEYRPSYKASANWTHDRFNLKVLYEHQETDTGSPVQLREPFSQKSILSIQPRYTFAFGGSDSIEIAPSATWFDKSIIRRARNASIASDEGGGSESSLALRTTYQTTRFEDQQVALGFSFARRDVQSLRHYFSSDPDRNTTHVDGDWIEYAVFAEDKTTLDPRTTLTLGLRQDWAEFGTFRSSITRFPEIEFTPGDVSNLSVRAALTYQASNEHTLRLSYQQGFLYPLLSQYPRAAAVNTVLREFGLEPLNSLDTESVDSLEFGIHSRLLNGRINSQLTLYYNLYQDLAGFRNIRNEPLLAPPEVLAAVPDAVAGIGINSEDDFASVGAEVSLVWDVSPQLRATFGYAYSIPSGLSEQANRELNIANESRSQWSVYPKHQVKAGLEYRAGKWAWAIAGVYENEVDTSETLGGRPIFDDNYTRVNAIVQHHLRKDLSVFVIGKNLFNDDTPPLNTTPTQPWAGNLGTDARLFYVGLKWQPVFFR